MVSAIPILQLILIRTFYFPSECPFNNKFDPTLKTVFVHLIHANVIKTIINKVKQSLMQYNIMYRVFSFFTLFKKEGQRNDPK